MTGRERWGVRLYGTALACAVGLLGFCGTAATQDTEQANVTRAYAKGVNELAARIAKDIAQNHIQSVAVIGGGGPDEKMTRLGDTLANALSESLAAQQAGFSVVGRPALRAFLQRERVSAFMLERDVLAGWITQKLNVDSYVAVQIKSAKKDRVELGAELFRPEGGKPLASEKEGISLDADVVKAGMQPLLLPQVHLSTEALKHPSACLNCNATRGALKPGDAVSLALTVLPTGEAAEIFIRSGSNQGANGRAVETVQVWKFSPAQDRSGNAVATTIDVNFNGTNR
jgi:hypothetical protein